MAEGAEEAIIGERGHGQSARSNDLQGGRVTVIRLLFQMHVEGMAFPLLPAGTIERISDSMMGRPTAIRGDSRGAVRVAALLPPGPWGRR